MSKRSIDSIFQTRSITTKEAGTSFNTSPKNNNNNKKRKSLSSFFSSFHITRPSLQKLSSIYLIITVLFQSMAGLFLFSPVPQAKAAISWYNTSYSYRKQITIDRTKIPHTDTNNTNPYLTDFPVLVSLTDDNLKLAPTGKVQKEDGSDIIFANQSGTTLLNYEIESYDNTTGNINAWVKIPQLNDINNTQDTVIYMYYGNSTASANTASNIQGVWDSSFKMVQHMNQTGTNTVGDYKDSTVNANNSTGTVGQPTVVAGQIGQGQSLDGNSYINISNPVLGSSKASICLWAKKTEYLQYQGFISDYNNVTGGRNFFFNEGNTGGENSITFGVGDGTNINSVVKNGFTSNSWHYICGAFDGGNSLKVYIDGTSSSITTSIGSMGLIQTAYSSIGTHRKTYNFHGLMDEVRVSNTARSSDWISTEYINQSNPSSFYSIGSEEDSVTPPSLSEVTKVQNPSKNTTPSYIFSSTKSGDIAYSGDCSSSTVFANSGNNTITFNTLSSGIHNNCTITVTDAAGNTSNTLNISSFTINPNYTWYNNSWSYRKQITVDRNKIPHTDTNNTNPYLTDFPILVSLTDNNLKSVSNGGKVQKEDGSDIIFSNQAGTTLLNYEIESYEASTGTLAAWVKIPQLNDTNNTQNTVIYMYYGNFAASANTASNMQGVWDSNFKMVQHMNQTGIGAVGDYKDSTVNGNDSTNTTYQPTVANGKIGKAESFDGADDIINFGSPASLNFTNANNFTFQLWARDVDTTINNYSVAGLFARPNAYGIDYYPYNNQVRAGIRNAINGAKTVTYSPLDNLKGWNYIVFTYMPNSADGIKVYNNGNLKSTLSTIGISDFVSGASINMGSSILAGNGLWFNGLIDEARISNIARSTDWIVVEYNNEFNPSAFLIISPQQSVSISSLDHFSLTGSSSQPSGSPQAITITAVDYEGNTLSSYTGDKEITFSGANTAGDNNPTATDKNGNSIPFGSSTTIAFTNGIAHANITLYKAQTAGIGIKDDDNYSSSGYNLSVNVSPQDNIQSIGISAPLFAVSGNSFSLTLSLRDIYGNPTGSLISPATLSTDKGSISPSSIPSSSFTNGTYAGDFTISNVTENTDVTITARYNNITSETTIPMRGIAQMDHFIINKADIQTADADIIIGKTKESDASNFFFAGDYADDAACIQSALDYAQSGDTILIREGDYQIARQVSQTGKDLNIIGEGEAKMHVNSGQSFYLGFYLAGTYIKETPVSVDASKGSNTITIQDASNVSPGDLITIYNSTLWCSDDYPSQKTGEMYEIKSISGNNVTLKEGLLRDYPVSLSSKARIYHPVKINIRNLSVFGTDAEGDGWGIELQYCKDSSVTDGYFKDNGDRSLAVFTCSNVDVDNNIILNSNKDGLGYGVSVSNASMNIRIHDNLMRNCRHAIMSGTGEFIALNRNVYILNNILYQDTGKGHVIDAHQITIDYFVNGNTVYVNNDYAFNDGTQYSIFTNNIVYGGLAAVAKRGYVPNAVKIITRNTVLNTSLAYSIFPNTKNIYLANNYIIGNPDNYAVYSPSTGIQTFTIQNNKIIGTLNPFYITIPSSSTSNLNISNNQINNPQRSAAYISYASTSSGTLNLYNNTIHNPSSYSAGSNAIELYNVKDSLIAANHITDDNHKTLYGIYEDSNSSNNNIFQNTSSGILGHTLFSQSNSTNLNEGTIPTDTPTLYPLTVTNGSGSGSYEVGEEVSITANIPQNKIFDRWTGDIGYISDIYSPSAIATLPQEPITLIPTYKDIDTIKKGEIITVNIKAMSTGKDSYVDYSGDKQVVFSGANKEGEGKTAIRPTASDKDGKDIPFGYSTTLTFRNGIATSNIKLYKGETAYINITDGTYTSFNDQTYSFPLTVQTENSSTPSFPPKPSAQDMSAIFKDGAVSLTNLPNAIKQIAVSLTNDFIHSSWIAIEDMENILKSYTNTDKLYIKLRTDTGAVSDTITYTPQTSNTDTTNPDTTTPLQDGDIVKTPNNPDIYVIKIQNNKKYKRLILSPHVFNSYQHLKWENIKTISEEHLNQYQTSSLVKEATDTIIYALTSQGDQGQRKPFDITQTYDPDSIYTINKVDRDSYEWEE